MTAEDWIARCDEITGRNDARPVEFSRFTNQKLWTFSWSGSWGRLQGLRGDPSPFPCVGVEVMDPSLAVVAQRVAAGLEAHETFIRRRDAALVLKDLANLPPTGFGYVDDDVAHWREDAQRMAGELQTWCETYIAARTPKPDQPAHLNETQTASGLVDTAQCVPTINGAT